jgi:hypothetical protein
VIRRGAHLLLLLAPLSSCYPYRYIRDPRPGDLALSSARARNQVRAGFARAGKLYCADNWASVDAKDLMLPVEDIWVTNDAIRFVSSDTRSGAVDKAVLFYTISFRDLFDYTTIHQNEGAWPWSHGWVGMQGHGWECGLGFHLEDEAQRFSAGLNRLILGVRGEPRPQPPPVPACPAALEPSEQAWEEQRLAVAAFEARDIEAALDHFESALDLAPCWPEARFDFALLLGESGDVTEAIDQMNRYLASGPSADEAREAREWVAQWTRRGAQ